MVKIQFYPVDITSKTAGERLVISLYGRTPDGKQVCVNDYFEPYFWVICEGPETEEFQKRVSDAAKEHIVRTEYFAKNYFGKSVNALKVFVKPNSLSAAASMLKCQRLFHQSMTGGLKHAPVSGKVSEHAQKPLNQLNRMNIPPTYDGWFLTNLGPVVEADIPITRRYLVDRNMTPLMLCEAEGDFVNQRSKVAVFNAESIRSGSELIPEQRILSVDIETHSPIGKILSPENPILMIGLYGENFSKVITWKRFNTQLDYVEFVESEAKLIERFVEAVEQYKPDVLTGYFSDGFDLPYISERADRYKIELNLGLDYSALKFKKGQVSSAYIAGITHLDIFKFVRNIFGSSLDTNTYDLNSVSKEILNENKNSVDLDRLPEIWESKPDELEEYCRYNLQDALLTYKLAKKLMPDIIELVKLTGLPVYDVSRMGFSQLVECYLIKRAPDFNELIPPKPGNETIGERMQTTYEGAFVFEPKPGLYKNIVVFDFRSLYPTIISAHNISPDTIDCSCCAPEEKADHWFCKRRKGFISTVINELVIRRMRIKEIMRSAEKDILLEARQSALKTIANAMYGYMAFFGARWYSIECARSITAYERQYIHKLIERAENEGFNVLYSDTDSIFLALDGKTQKDVQVFVDSVNMDLPELMELDFEGLYPVGIFVSAKVGDFGAKKKYALLDEKGAIKIKGFETVRRNLSIIAKEVQERVLEIVLREENPEKALEFVRDVVKKLRNRQIPLEKVIITTQLQKEVSSYDSIGPHVAVAQRMKNLGKIVVPGALIKYVITKGKERIGDRARLPEEIIENDYDPEYYINNQVMPSVEKIFEVLGYKEEELLGKEQVKLDEFF